MSGLRRRTSGEAPELLKRLAPALTSIDRRLAQPPRPDAARAGCRPDEVSVIVQGPVVGADHPDPALQHTRRCVDSVRRVLPGAELVLSTWRGADVRGLDVDAVVLSHDPGPVASRDPAHVPNNVNRQIVSTRAGMEHATRRVAIKLRSDMVLEHDGALRLLGGWPERHAQVRALRERVLVPAFYTFNPRRVYARFPYMVSDWFHVGLREDLIDIWSAPHWDVAFEWLLGRRLVAAEQWIWMSLLNRHDMDAFVGRPDVVAHSELALVNNTVVLEPEDLGIRLLKFSPHAGHQAAVYTHGEWARLYARHCLGRARPGWDRQAVLRATVDRLWIRGLAVPLVGPPADLVPRPLPVAPPCTPDTSEVAR